MLIRLCLIVVFVCTSAVCRAERKLVPVPVAEVANYATPYAASFRVRDTGDGSAGSAVGIGPHLVVTNSHVVGHEKGGHFVVWHSIESGRWKGTCIGGNRASDVALIQIDGTVPYVPLAAADPRQGDACQVYGYGRQGKIRHADGKLLRVYQNDATGVDVANLSIMTEPGDSGSGVFTSGGALFAINWGGDDPEAGMAYATPVSYVRQLIQRVCPDGRCASASPSRPAPSRPGLQPMRPIDQPPQKPAPVPDPIAGDPGEPGQDGKDGADGADGKDGRGIVAIAIAEGDLVVEFTDGTNQTIENWVDSVAKKLPPIYPQWIDEDGNVIDELRGGVRLGQTMPLRLEVRQMDALKRELDQLREQVEAIHTQQ